MSREGVDEAGAPPALLDEARAKLAAFLGIAWSSIAILYGVLLAVLVPILVAGDRRNGYCESIDHPGRCSSVAPVVVGALAVVAVGLWGIVACVGLRRGRTWARRAVLVTFAVWAVIPVAGLTAAMVDPDEVDFGGLMMMLLLLVHFGAIVVLTARAPRPRPPTIGGPSG